jgi:hypothetical protein
MEAAAVPAATSVVAVVVLSFRALARERRASRAARGVAG